MTIPPPMLRRRTRIRSIPAPAHIASTASSGCRSQNPSMLGPRKRPVCSHPGPATAPASGRPHGGRERSQHRRRVVDVAEQVGVRERVDGGRLERQPLGVGLDQVDPVGQAGGGDARPGAREHVGALVDPDHPARVAAGERHRHGARPGGDVGHDRALVVGRRSERVHHHVVPAPVLPEREQLGPAVVVRRDAGEEAAGVALALRDCGHGG
jgi:hypothetical protein